MNGYEQNYDSVANSMPEVRAAFIRRTYTHLAGALLVFMALTAGILRTDAAEQITMTFLGTSYSWLIVLGGFMGVSMLANWWANSSTSRAMQYLGLGLYVVAQAVIFTPLLFIAENYAPDAIGNAAVVSLALFAALTAVVFLTRKDFSFLGPILMIGGFVALGVIVASFMFGFNLGTIFAGVMVLFAGGAILYDTSNVLHRYHESQHVAASLSLFASVALLFWYVLQIFMSRD